MIPIVVVGHPKREKQANQLAAAVQADAISWDVGRWGCSYNHLQAWQWLAEDYNTDWGVVIEDDVIPCNHFRRNLEEAVKNSPAPILSLYLGRGRPPHRQTDIARVITAPVSYYTDSELMSTQGYAMRAEYFDCWAAVRHRRQNWTIERAISRWAQRSNLGVAYCRQSLIEHIDGLTLIQDHGDGQGRNGKTALWTPDCDPSGRGLPEIRKSWLMANTTTDWTQGSRALPIDGIKAARKAKRK